MWTRCQIEECRRWTRWSLSAHRGARRLLYHRGGDGTIRSTFVEQACSRCRTASPGLHQEWQRQTRARCLEDAETMRRRCAEELPAWLEQAPRWTGTVEPHPMLAQTPPMYRSRHVPDTEETVPLDLLVESLTDVVLRGYPCLPPRTPAVESLREVRSFRVMTTPRPWGYERVLNRRVTDSSDTQVFDGSLYRLDDGDIRIVWQWAYTSGL